ncbi:MAG: DUF932 domain-containing protein [Candidatus Latescibacteria bacterium]|nr:DUF932 domain-containing protein [Candidatus Latescibacterota bacterium]
MNTATLMLHCGAKTATLEQLSTIPLPQETPSYKPLPHYDLALNTLRIGQEMLGTRGFQVDKAQFGLDREGARMFGTVSFANGVEGMGLAVGFRNSYDKTMSAGFALGGRVVVCDNLVLAGELVVMRKHTGGIIEELRDKLVLTFHQAHQTWDSLVEDRRQMQALELTDDRAHEILGRAFGQGLIAPKQFLHVSREWRQPRHTEFEERTLWSLYNAVTEVYKGLPVHLTMERHINLHRFAVQTCLGRPITSRN